jgi:hypothetical protein
MSLARSSKIRFHTEMKLYISNLKPGTATFGQLGWFWNFSKAQYIDIKSACLFLAFRRDRNLNVVDREDRHLWHHWVSGRLPGTQTAEDGFHMGKSVLQKEERRTGARVFILSGAVSDDPLIFFELDVLNI